MVTRSRPTELVGWREWVGLPDWGVEWVKAKIDTGARTSALHAFGITQFTRDGTDWVRFAVHPWQRSADDEVWVEAEQTDERAVTSSSGVSTVRPVVRTPVRIGDGVRSIELTLTRRDEMGFRMLLGRQAVRGAFLVDPARSYINGRPARSIRRKNRGAA